MYELHKFLNLIFYATVVPGTLVIFWLTGLITLATVQFCLILFGVFFILLPLIFRYSVTLQRGVLFLTFITYPKGLDLTNPASIGLYATRNFYLTVRDDDADLNGVRIGVWHVLPAYMVKRFKRELQVEEALRHESEVEAEAAVPASSDLQGESSRMSAGEQALEELEHSLKSEFPLVEAQNEQLFYERLLKLPGGTVVIYLHGNTASRGSAHRSEIYKMLRKLNYHVLSFDYRGYADSDAVQPTEEGVVRDALAVFQYVSNLTSNPVIIWGHSLGTGVSTHLCARLANMNLKERGPRGIVLESPFTNIREEIRMHPFARPFKHLPWFDLTISRPMYRNLLRFESDLHVNQFPQPIMILHAEDDYVVPFQLGYKLYRIALDKRPKSWGPIEFHRFGGHHQYGHKYLVRAPELPNLVHRFVENYRDAVY